MKRFRLKTVMLTLLIVQPALFCGSGQLLAQDSYPREYTNPEEVISFSRDTPFRDAIEVIDQFSQQYTGKFIIDRSDYSDAIDINLPAMHWRDALNYILRVQNMVLLEEQDYLEILTRSQAEQRQITGSVDETEGTSGGNMVATTRTREVRINATFFEGNRRALQEIGVDWSTLTNAVPNNIQDFVTEQGTATIPETSFNSRFVQVNANGAQNVSQNVFNSLINFGDVGAGIEVQALFSAFEADNMGEILATPSVKVMDGEEGRIQVGQDFSIKQRDIAGNVIDQFFSTGTILTVTPQIIDNRDTTFIYLQLEVERSSVQPDPVSTIISKEDASTHTLLLNGESTVIAGLYRTDRSEVRRGIPILKDLPWWFFGLKYLFGYNSVDQSQSELIVIVQAELEQSIPQRMAQQLQTRRQVLETQQQINRTGLDYIPGSMTGTVNDTSGNMMVGGEFEPELNSALETQPDSRGMDIQDDVVPVPDRAEPEANLVRDNSSPDVEFEENNYRSMELTNLNGQNNNYRYYTIGGSFSQRDNAERLYNEIIANGFDAQLLRNSENNYFYVAYSGFINATEAENYTRYIQNSIQSDAWLSRIITLSQIDPAP